MFHNKFAHRLTLVAAASTLALVSACSSESEPVESETTSEAPAPDYGYETYSADNHADTMASHDDAAMSGEDAATPASGPRMPPPQDGSNGANSSGSNSSGSSSSDESAKRAQLAKSGNDAASDAASDSEDADKRPTMQLQVVLDRRGFGPGVIDGKMGMSTRNALSGFQQANGLDVTGEHDAATKQALAEWDRIPATRMVTIPEGWANASFTDIPESVAAKAELDAMGYTSLDEKLAERFHTTIDVLKALNPDARQSGGESHFAAGQRIRVPNIGGDRIVPGQVENRDWQRTLASLGVGTEQPEVDRIVVSKSGGTLKAFQGDQLVAQFTVTSGSSRFPLPLGEWDILGKAYNPTYSYDPEVLGQGEGQTYTLPPGPNSPVGVIWIDLSKEHYGIHGTDEPATIGRVHSSGCVRLTNWDAARLTQMVSQSTRVIFEA